jgi:hypothetical protein
VVTDWWKRLRDTRAYFAFSFAAGLRWAACRQIRAAMRDVEVDWKRRIGTPRFEQLLAVLRDLVASYER